MAAELATLQIKVDSSEIKTATSAMEGMTSSSWLLEKALAGMAGVWASIKIGEFIKETALLASRYETLGVAMHQVGMNAGYTANQMNIFEKNLEDTGISMIEARQNLSRMATAHLDLAQSAKLARGAQDVAVIGNINSSEAFERLVHGIQSGRTEILHTMGVQVQFEEGYKSFARTLNKTSAELTANEKAQSRMAQTLEFLTSVEGTYEAAMGTTGKQLKSLERYAEDAQVKLGALFQPALSAGVVSLTESLKNLQGWLDKNRDKTEALGLAMGEAETQAISFAKAIFGVGNEGTKGIQWMDLWTHIVGGLAGAFALASDTIRGASILISKDVVNIKSQLADLADTAAKFYDAMPGGKKNADIARGFAKWLDDSITKSKAFQDSLALGGGALERWAKSMLKIQNLQKDGGFHPDGPDAGDMLRGGAPKPAEQSKGEGWDYSDAEKMIEKLVEETQTFEMTGTAIEAYKFSMLGATDALKEQFKVMLDTKDELIWQKQRTDDARKAEEDLTEALNRQKQARLDAQIKEKETWDKANTTLTEQMMTPGERQIVELARLDEMLKRGLGVETYQRRLIQLKAVGTDVFATLADSIQSMTKGMEEAFVRFATTGKFSFKDMANSIIQDLIRIESQKAFVALASYLLNAAGSYFFGPAPQSGMGGSQINAWGSGSGGFGTGSGFNLGGGKIANPGGNVTSSVTVNVNSDGTSSSKVQGSAASGVELGNKIDAAIQKVMVREMRPGGLLNPVAV